MLRTYCSKRTTISADEEPRSVFHPSFESPDAEELYSPESDPIETAGDFMVDETTRDTARRMHYAAYRRDTSASDAEARRWRNRYYALRDAIVLGNRKLIYRTVRKWAGLTPYCDDLIGECYIVLIRTVRSYNPWLGIRFSTYACTCLFRALGRLTHRMNGTVLSHCVPLDLLGETAEPGEPTGEEASPEDLGRLGRFLREDHPLLSSRKRRCWLAGTG